MKKYLIFSVTFALSIGFAVNVCATPMGAQFSVNEINDPLILGFSGLTGSLSYNIFLETDPINSPDPLNVYILKPGYVTPYQIDRINFNNSTSVWVTRNLFDSEPSGDVLLQFIMDDYGNPDNALAYLKDFSSSTFYIRGGQQIPEPSTMILFGIGLIVIATCGRNLFTRK